MASTPSSQQSIEQILLERNEMDGNNNEIVEVRDDAVEASETEEIAEETGKRARRKTSFVWSFFEDITIKTTKNSGKAGEEKQVMIKTKCKCCGEVLSKPKSGTTSHMKRHLENVCPYYKRCDKKNKQSTLSFNSSNAEEGEILGFSVATPYEPKKVRDALARMILMHEYPFKMVEHPGFNVFAKILNPRYEKMSRNTIKNECLKVYDSERDKLKASFKAVDRISLTSDCWTSNQTIGYLCLTAHFIDPKWKLRRCIISFCDLEPPHTGVVIGDAIARCIQEWGVQDKIQTITLDNASNNTIVAEFLKANFESRNKLHLKGKIFHVRCTAHILNLMVQDGLKHIENTIISIRESVKYLKKSTSRLFKFGEIARQLDIPTSKGLRIDCPTRWNSTYLMLEHALTYKLAFNQYALRDANYKWLPTSAEWVKVEKICKFLEVFNDVTTIFSGSAYPTANLFFPEMCRVKCLLHSQLQSEDIFMKDMASAMWEKMSKYWGDCNLLLAIATILDPRNKMRFVEFAFPLLYPEHEVDYNLQMVKDALYEIYESYVTHPTQDFCALPPKSNDFLKKPGFKGREMFDMLVRNDAKQPSKSDLVIYLDEGLYVAENEVREQEFDVLEWWRLNSIKYRFLSKLARDILSIPITTVSSESAFSAGGRVLDPYRSSLSPKTVEALVCAGNWIREGMKGTPNPMGDYLEEEELDISLPDIFGSMSSH